MSACYHVVRAGALSRGEVMNIAVLAFEATEGDDAPVLVRFREDEVAAAIREARGE
jgi:hypothetical protein